jgi:hypothetical protein
MTTVAIVLGVLLLVLVLITPWLTGTARRLDRLHVRTDAAFAGLDAALGRRAVVARTVAATQELTRLVTCADAAEHASRPDRESRENDLTHALSTVDLGASHPALRRELVDAQHRVVLARNVYNSAVRDTRRLRSRRLVRWLRLSGTASLPDYFDIAEPELTSTIFAQPLRANEDNGTPRR